MCSTRAPAPRTPAPPRRRVRAVGRVGRHQVGDVAHHEQLARPRVEDHLGRHPRVAAADDHDLRRLPGVGQLAVARPARCAGGRRGRRSIRQGGAAGRFMAVSCPRRLSKKLKPRSPSAGRERRAAGIGKRLRQARVNPPRDRGAGEGVEPIVDTSLRLGWHTIYRLFRKSVPNQQASAQIQARFVKTAFPLFRFI